jgi:phage terminase small subunit
MAKKPLPNKHDGRKNLFEIEDATISLTDRQKRFCIEYINANFNGAEAARKAGYAEDSAHVQASQFLTNPNIQTYIELLKKDLGLRLGITQERIAQEMAKIAFFNIADILNDDGSLKSLDGLDRDLTANIKSVELVELISEKEVIGKVKKIGLNDKQAALTGLNRMLGYDAPIKQANTNVAGEDLPTTFVFNHNGVEPVKE